MAVNEVNTEILLGVVADEEGDEILDMRLGNVRLGLIVLEVVEATGRMILANAKFVVPDTNAYRGLDEVGAGKGERGVGGRVGKALY